MDRDTRIAAAAWLAQGRPGVIVEVGGTAGSAPRDTGTRMLVSRDEAIGTIGGGHLELRAIATAREMLRSSELTPHAEHVALGPALGQCCGGSVDLRFHALDSESLAAWPTSLPLMHLQLYGAGHVGRAVATLLATLDVVVDWIDERDDPFAPTTTLGTPWPAHIRRVCVDAVEAEVAVAPAGASYLVMTHRHDLDMRIAEAILRRGDFAYLGLIGSKTKRARFVRRLGERGIAEDRLARITCPIGVVGIEGKEPEVLAVAVLAELLRAASGSRLSSG
jgi:xanthine dehydrogenase accessory factor